ncbi:MAG: hypothetical protein RL326_97 [Pseudomonadota bacterium]
MNFKMWAAIDSQVSVPHRRDRHFPVSASGYRRDTNQAPTTSSDHLPHCGARVDRDWLVRAAPVVTKR